MCVTGSFTCEHPVWYTTLLNTSHSLALLKMTAGRLSAGKNAKVGGSGLTGVPVSPFGPGTPGMPGDPWKMQRKDTWIYTVNTFKLSCSSSSGIPAGLVVQQLHETQWDQYGPEIHDEYQIHHRSEHIRTTKAWRMHAQRHLTMHFTCI